MVYIAMMGIILIIFYLIKILLLLVNMELLRELYF